MSALVGYGSSDEEGVANGDHGEVLERAETPISPHASKLPLSNGTSSNGGIRPHSPSDGPQPERFQSPSNLTHGESVGPTAPPATSSALSSPYTSTRSTIQQLTLPMHPNLSIPPSPPTSPAPGLDQKVSHFLDLKRQGIHFNAKLANSSALKNPSLLPKLMESTGLDGDGGRDQYRTTLPGELWDPDRFPERFYKEGLAKMQQEVGKRKDEERRGKERTFVPKTAEVGVAVNGGGRESAAERVMAGLERTGQKEAERNAKRRKG